MVWRKYKMSINYVIGDATKPVGTGKKIIIHVCNNIGGWGSGFVIAVSNRWKEPESEYRKWSNQVRVNDKLLPLGEVQFVNVEDDIVIGNMIGQHMTHWIDGIPPIRYDAVETALQSVANYALRHNCSVHAPRFGSGLAGGEWSKIEQLINTHLCSKDIPVTIYDFEESPSTSDEIMLRKNESNLFKDIM